VSYISVEKRFTLLSEEDLLPQTLVLHLWLSNMNMQIPYGSFAYESKHNIHKELGRLQAMFVDNDCDWYYKFNIINVYNY